MNSYSKYPKVSIITPSFNQGQFIERTIMSVLSQDYPNIEYIIIDGKSTDQTISILEKYQDQLIYISETDMGQADAINKGIRLATGEILAYLNSDDTYPPGAISAAVNFFIYAHPESVFLYGEGNYIDTRDTVIKRYPTKPFSMDNLYRTCIICQPSTFWKRTVFEDIGYFNDRLDYCMDYEYWIRIAQRYGHLDYIPIHLGNSREYAETKTLANRFIVHQEIFLMLKKTHGGIPFPWVYSYAKAIIEQFFERENKIRINLLYGITFLIVLPFLILQYRPLVTKEDLHSLVSMVKNSLLNMKI